MPSVAVAQTPSDSQAPPPVAIQSQPADSAAPPVVSPIEQYGLAGNYLINPRVSESQALNNRSTGIPVITSVKPPDFQSAFWSFEAVAGAPFALIRSAWRGDLLRDNNGQLLAAPSAPDDRAAQWFLEPANGEPFVYFRNAATGRTLVVDRGQPRLADTVAVEQNAQWELTVAPPPGDAHPTFVRPRPGARPAAPSAAAPGSVVPGLAAGAAGAAVGLAVARPQIFSTPIFRDRTYVPPGYQSRSAYDFAVANCRELQGFWTGSTCLPSPYARPGRCPPGYAWSMEAGGCQFDGGTPGPRAGGPPLCPGGVFAQPRGSGFECPTPFRFGICPPGTTGDCA